MPAKRASNYILRRRRAQVGFPEFSNEVQHQTRVLRWEQSMISSRWRNAVKLPAYKPTGVRSGKSLQLWIARHRASRASEDAIGDSRAATSLSMVRSAPRLGAGKARR